MRQIRFIEIEHEEERLGRQELKSPEALRVLGAELKRPERTSGFERGAALFEHVLLAFQVGVRGRLLRVALEAFEAPFDDAQVREDDFLFHRAHIARGIDGSRRVRHRRIAKQADDVQQRVGVAKGRDVEQRGRTRPHARGTAHVGELDRRRHVFLGVEQRRQLIQTRIRHP